MKPLKKYLTRIDWKWVGILHLTTSICIVLFWLFYANENLVQMLLFTNGGIFCLALYTMFFPPVENITPPPIPPYVQGVADSFTIMRSKLPEGTLLTGYADDVLAGTRYTLALDIKNNQYVAVLRDPL